MCLLASSQIPKGFPPSIHLAGLFKFHIQLRSLRLYSFTVLEFQCCELVSKPFSSCCLYCFNIFNSSSKLNGNIPFLCGQNHWHFEPEKLAKPSVGLTFDWASGRSWKKESIQYSQSSVLLTFSSLGYFNVVPESNGESRA